MNGRKVDDNTVRYCLYPNLSSDQCNADEKYQIYINDSLAKLTNYLIDYFWYYTPFNLNYVNQESSHSKSKF